jgi:predicted ArsR family transcriptional regulator
VDQPDDLEIRISGVAALDQPLRRDLYRLLAERDGWLGRDDAASALGVPRSVAAFHLDKLADAGVVEVTFERTTGRSGPGAGRPSKLYRRSRSEVSASVPDRHYDLAAALLAGAIEASARSDQPVTACLSACARARGRAIGEGAAPTGRRSPLPRVGQVVERHGYEPRTVGGELALGNCPFHRLAEQHRSLVCGMNLDLLGGVLEGMALDDRLTVRLQPEPGWCCVRIAPR